MACDVGIDASEETVRNDLSNVETPVLGCRATGRRGGRDLMAQVTQVEEDTTRWVPEWMSANIERYGFDVLCAIHLKNRKTGSRVAKAQLRAIDFGGADRVVWRAARQSEKCREAVTMKRACVEITISKER